MKFNRRKFLKICMGTVAATIIPAIPTFPKPAVIEAAEAITPPKIKGEDCQDFSPQITIHDYSPGAPVRYQDLNIGRDCGMCQHAHACTCKGEKFINEKGMFVPEIWNKELISKLYRRS